MRMEVLNTDEAFVLIRLDGRLDLKGVEEIQLSFTVNASRSEKPVLVDLGSVTFVGSLAIGMLFASARNLHLRGSRMTLFGATPHIEEVLRTASVNLVAGLVATEGEARQAATGA